VSSSETAVDTRIGEYALRLGDDALVLAQRTGEWIASAPELEEDLALGNLALDLLGQARTLLTYAGQADGSGRSEDDLAYFRDEREFRNCQLVELPNGDFGATMARLFVFAAYQYELYSRLVDSADETLPAIAAKALKEVAYHRDHAGAWVIRLGDGTDESHRRMQTGLDRIWLYVHELFESDELTGDLAAAKIAVDPADLAGPTLAHVRAVLAEATLDEPEPSNRHSGGRQGVHTEQMGYLLAEMQHLARSHPGAQW
jgi:ring-1,2-phenylacetyl-CoA epoxidase subunit PaaC